MPSSSGPRPDYFRTFAIPLLRGRLYEASDRGDAAPVAVVSEGARPPRYWPDRSPLGARITLATRKIAPPSG